MICSQGYGEETNMDGNITATLRLAHRIPAFQALLVKHAWELRHVLERGLAATPTAPWKGALSSRFDCINLFNVVIKYTP